MNVVHHRIPVLIVGTNSVLGYEITKYALLNPNLQVSVLVPEASKDPDSILQIEAAGGSVITGDLSDLASLQDVTKGFHTVISAIDDYDEKVYFDGQKALVEDAIRNGVRRFVPSGYELYANKFHKEEIELSPRHCLRQKFEDYLETSNIQTLKFYIGLFPETLFEILQTLQCYYGEPELKHNLTTIENTARLVVAGVATAALTGNVYYSGGDYTIRELQDVYNKVRGTNVEVRRAGYIGDLRHKYEEVRSQEGAESEKAKFLGSMVVLFDKRSKFSTVDDDSFPDVQTTSLEEYLQANTDISLEKKA